MLLAVAVVVQHADLQCMSGWYASGDALVHVE